MPYRDTAAGLASLGRHGDDTLVHMGRDEVQGLQALAMAQGGSLSINPHTGMPEAFSLKNTFKKFLPTIAGAAGAAMGLGPAGQILAGGLTGAATSKGNLLKGFAMGALGGYGGGGLYKGFMGTAGAAGATGTEAATAGADVGAGGAGGTGVGGMNAGESARVAREVTAGGGMGGAGVGAGATAPGSLYGTTSAGPPGALQSFDKAAGDFASRLPPGAQNMIADQSFGKSGLAALTSGASRTPTPKMDDSALYRQYDYNPENQQFTAREPSNEFVDPYAPGGASGGTINDIASQNNYLASLSRGGAGDTDIDGFTGEARYAYGGDTGIDDFTGGDQYAYGGPMDFQTPVKRRKPRTSRKQYLQGPGDGVSDSIPAVIHTGKRPRPARLAAGEFIVPARVVAELGNGSSDAGSKQLYAMLDRIESRMKSSKRGKDSGARGELPA